MSKVKIPRSPRITRLAWGKLEVEGAAKPYRDAKVFPGGSRAWDWGETGTHHSPGIQPGDVQELIDRGAKTIVLSQGVFGRLEVASETLKHVNNLGLVAHVLRTGEAVSLYNRLCETEPVGALIHSTC